MQQSVFNPPSPSRHQGFTAFHIHRTHIHRTPINHVRADKWKYALLDVFMHSPECQQTTFGWCFETTFRYFRRFPPKTKSYTYFYRVVSSNPILKSAHFEEVPIVFAHPEHIEGRQYDATFCKTTYFNEPVITPSESHLLTFGRFLLL